MSENSFSRETAEAVAEAVRPWLDQDAGETPPAAALVAALRAAEAEHGGRQRDLWGHAAGNAACAMRPGDERSARWLWAAALDYARLAAVPQGTAVPRASETLHSAQVTLT
ncbi:hypothetical protein [Streptomyces microflavus]|uniref:hypothetical protein n=1 Tax=Streptomyces microflavus TaxID=1919 RepID=UPI003646C28D